MQTFPPKSGLFLVNGLLQVRHDSSLFGDSDFLPPLIVILLTKGWGVSVLRHATNQTLQQNNLFCKTLGNVKLKTEYFYFCDRKI